MKQVRWYNYIEIAVISIIATVILTFLFGTLGFTENKAYSEIAQRQFFGHNSLLETIGLYCVVSPVVEELIFRFGIFNLLLIIIKKAGYKSVDYDRYSKDMSGKYTSADASSSSGNGISILVHVVVWITAALFGIYHMNLVQGLYAFLMGLVITYSYAVYRKFSIPVVAHICANATALFITYLG